MNETILIIVFVTILFALQILASRIKKPLLHYIRISAAIGLLLLVWLFGGEGNIPFKVILSVLALTSLYKEYLSIKKLESGS